MTTHAESQKYNGLEIAIIGMAVRVPGAHNLAEFWQNMQAGVETITSLSDEELIAAGVDKNTLNQPNYVGRKGILDNIEFFDASFFGISPRDAEIMDPQQRLFLECAWEALEHAGCVADVYNGPIGVYAGSSMNGYILHNIVPQRERLRLDERHLVIHNDKDFLATRVSYKLNLKGPSLTIQTACSTSLVAVHLASQGLLSGECDVALAGGVTIRIPHKTGYLYYEGGIDSPDGRCRAFDASARGIVRGSGVGVVVLKRLADALADGDHICAVIKGSAINNDGASKVSYTAPAIDGQVQVIRSALLMADVEADTISYIETHGTGTVQGDLIEFSALRKAFSASPMAPQSCALGSVKTNLGHLDAAAGVVGLIKTVLSLEHGQIPPSLHFEQPNPQLDMIHSSFYVNTMLKEWKHGTYPRRAGVSSFGIGGTNAHVVLEEAPIPEGVEEEVSWQVVVLSARTPTALQAATKNLAHWLQQNPSHPLNDIAYTLQTGRKAFDYRHALVGQSSAEILQGLDTSTDVPSFCQESPSCVFLFPGQGAQYLAMASELYQHIEEFRTCVDRCCELLQPVLGFDLRSIIYPSPDQQEQAQLQIRQTAIAQPALFVIEYALAQLWMSWGIHPTAMIGHSLGEYVAACLAEVLSLEDALWLVAQRGKIMQQLSAGAMVSVPLSEEMVFALMDPQLSIAAVNAPRQCVVAGEYEAIERWERQLHERGIETRRLFTSHAFHSNLVDSVLSKFREALTQVAFHSPKIPYISNVSGTWITEKQARDPDYWLAHARHTVRFADGIREISQGKDSLWLEVGPGHTLTSFVQQQVSKELQPELYRSLPEAGAHPEVAHALQTLGRLWSRGAPVQWEAVHQQKPRYKVQLPTYPFERQHFWIDAASSQREQLSSAPSLDSWMHIPYWKPALLPARERGVPQGNQEGSILVFLDEHGLGNQIAEELARQGQRVISVEMGAEFSRLSSTSYTMAPHLRTDYEALVRHIVAEHDHCKQVIHLWSLTEDEGFAEPFAEFEEFQQRGFYSLVYLVQALGEPGTQEEMRISVVSNHTQNVNGTENVWPGKATILGPCKVIPQEYPSIRCSFLDIELPPAGTWQREQLVHHLSSEVLSEQSEPMICYRSNRRWVQAFEPVQVAETEAVPLRKHGVYLITGGLGGVGLELATYLSQNAQAKLVLLSRSAFPAREQWEQYMALGQQQKEVMRDNHVNTHRNADKIVATLPPDEGTDGNSSLRFLKYPQWLEDKVNLLCLSYICAFCKRHGISLSHGATYQESEIRNRLHIDSSYHKMFTALLTMLEKDLVLKRSAGEVTFTARVEEIGEPEILKAEIEQQYPAFKAVLALLDHCVRHYDDVFRNIVSGISVLYPDGQAHMVEQAMQCIATYSNEMEQTLRMREYIASFLKNSSKKHITILEIGAGNGRLTKAIMPALQDYHVEYFYTDISNAFLLKAQKELQDSRNLSIHYRLFDITRSAAEQGFRDQTFDLILGLNVVHTARNIKEVLNRLNSLLAPHGSLFLIEPIKPHRWVDMIWGLTEGWWNFNDGMRTTSPLLNAQQWEQMFTDLPFQQVVVSPEQDTERESAEYGLIIGQAPGGNNRASSPDEQQLLQHKISRLLEMEKQGADVLVLQADVSDQAEMGTALRLAKERFGQLHGVIHAAVVEGGGTIYFKNPDLVESEFAPKIKGTSVLDTLLQDEPLDFFLLCSSINALVGGIGLVTYCAASNALDAYAHYALTHRKARTIAVNWDRWRDVGTARVASERHKLLTGEEPGGGMTAAEGVEVFGRILASQLQPEVAIFTQFSQRYREEQGSALASPVLARRTVSGNHARPALQNSYIAPRNDIEQRVARIWQEVLGIAQIGVQDDFSSLGGDSLLVIQLVSRLREEFPIELPLQRFFETPTVAGIATAIAENGAGPKDLNELEQILEEIEKLGPEEVRERLGRND